LIRKQLNKYHLYEMPEEWNQLAFDHHVHDSNSKGRKSPTHIVMDAWIKGIRFLGVIYYNFIRTEAASELLEAAEIMDIEVRIGVELSACLHNRYVQLVWSPNGFFDRHDFIKFINGKHVKAFMDKGREVRDYKTEIVLKLLDNYNRIHRNSISETYDIHVPELPREKFITFVGRGQASLVHLAEFIHKNILPDLKKRVSFLRDELKKSSNSEKKVILKKLRKINSLIPEKLVEKYFRRELNPEITDTSIVSNDPDLPELLRLNSSQIIDLVSDMPCRSRITLNPTDLSLSDVIETLYEGEGRITHLEIYNSKDWAHKKTEHRIDINKLRLVINNQNVMELKKIVMEQSSIALEQDKVEGTKQGERLDIILGDLPRFLSFYQYKKLRSRMGTDSTGRSRITPGMGLVVLPTLPWRARRKIISEKNKILPIVTTPLRNTTSVIGDKADKNRYEISMQRERRNNNYLKRKKEVKWTFGSNTTTLCDKGNIAALGGISNNPKNNIINTSEDLKKKIRSPLHLNSTLLNFLKIFIGFIPAFLTFYLTKSWWLLAWFGAVIWFSITGFRNIIQSVLGGGGLFRNSLLGWKDYVNWSRVADSLLFTGFSVPLLDFLVKDLLLARTAHITPSNNALALYSVIALANGIYISSHNLFRGLPIGAVIGNFFRTIISIPVAIGLNFLILRILLSSGRDLLAVQTIMFLWAAVISKFASDLVAAIIEGSADRRKNLDFRINDYREKLQQIYHTYARLEMIFPKQDVQKLMEDPEKLVAILKKENPEVLRLMIINSLDMLYFWMYQPRSSMALKLKLLNMSSNELHYLLLFQNVLKCKRTVSEMLLHSLVGKRFERALAFYLSRTDNYLNSFKSMVTKVDRNRSSNGFA
jgi:hypothetical protein